MYKKAGRDKRPSNVQRRPLLNHHHRKVLHALYEHPVSANISAKDVETVLGELGAELHSRSGARYSATLNGKTVVFHHRSHSLSKDDVHQVKTFLTECDVDPARDFPL